MTLFLEGDSVGKTNLPIGPLKTKTMHIIANVHTCEHLTNTDETKNNGVISSQTHCISLVSRSALRFNSIYSIFYIYHNTSTTIAYVIIYTKRHLKTVDAKKIGRMFFKFRFT